MPDKSRIRKSCSDILIPRVDLAGKTTILALVLKDADAIHDELRAVHLRSSDAIHLTGDTFNSGSLTEQFILDGCKVFILLCGNRSQLDTAGSNGDGVARRI